MRGGRRGDWRDGGGRLDGIWIHGGVTIKVTYGGLHDHSYNLNTQNIKTNSKKRQPSIFLISAYKTWFWFRYFLYGYYGFSIFHINPLQDSDLISDQLFLFSSPSWPGRQPFVHTCFGFVVDAIFCFVYPVTEFLQRLLVAVIHSIRDGGDLIGKGTLLSADAIELMSWCSRSWSRVLSANRLSVLVVAMPCLSPMSWPEWTKVIELNHFLGRFKKTSKSKVSRSLDVWDSGWGLLNHTTTIIIPKANNRRI